MRRGLEWVGHGGNGSILILSVDCLSGLVSELSEIFLGYLFAVVREREGGGIFIMNTDTRPLF